jgi:hypothetical protein
LFPDVTVTREDKLICCPALATTEPVLRLIGMCALERIEMRELKRL